MKLSIGKKISFGISILIGIGLISLGIFLLFDSISEVIFSIKLESNGIETLAKINRVKHEMSADENEEGDVSIDELYFVDYTFKIKNGDEYKGSSQTSDNPVENSEDFTNTKVYIPEKEFLIKIMYESGNPTNNLIVNDRNKLSNKIIRIILFTLIGLTALYLGVNSCKEKIKRIMNNNSKQS